MRFILIRTSEKTVDSDDYDIDTNDIYYGYADTRFILPNFIEFKTLEDFINFQKEVGEVVITQPDEYDIKDYGFTEPILEIYDYYRE